MQIPIEHNEPQSLVPSLKDLCCEKLVNMCTKHPLVPNLPFHSLPSELQSELVKRIDQKMPWPFYRVCTYDIDCTSCRDHGTNHDCCSNSGCLHSITTLAFSDDESMLAASTTCWEPDPVQTDSSAPKYQKIFIWDIAQQKLIHEISMEPQDDNHDILDIQFTPDNKQLIIYTAFIDSVNQTTISLPTHSITSSLNNCLQLSTIPDLPRTNANGNQLDLTKFNNESIKNTLQGKLIRKNHQLSDLCISALSNDGTILASDAQGNTVNLWDPTTGNCIKLLMVMSHNHRIFQITSMAFSPDNQSLATLHRNQIKVFDFKKGYDIHNMQKMNLAYNQTKGSIIFSPSGQLLVLGYSHTIDLLRVIPRDLKTYFAEHISVSQARLLYCVKNIYTMQNYTYKREGDMQDHPFQLIDNDLLRIFKTLKPEAQQFLKQTYIRIPAHKELQDAQLTTIPHAKTIGTLSAALIARGLQSISLIKK
ncbi:MAG: hypothetical protein WA432_03975 [Candidatus Babeliaceae bacterium]